MSLADIVRALERTSNRRGIVTRRKQGWVPRILPYTGYGSTTALRVLARALMDDPNATASKTPFAKGARRGWRQFFTTQVGNLRVTVEIGGKTYETRTDESGYIDLLVENHGLDAGTHTATITPAAGIAAEAPVIIVSDAATTGIVSDIDDTIVITLLPRPMLATWNSFILHTNARKAVPGMAEFYGELLRERPDTPVFYLSTGAWNTAPTMSRFIRKNGLPSGPLLMTDWGPTPTGLFRSGQEHKKTQLRNLLIMFPNIRWILVGDDGQHDPLIYGELAREHPSRVEAVALRQLDPVEQVLSHGLPVAVKGDVKSLAARPVPFIGGKDGFELLKRWHDLKQGRTKQRRRKK